MASLEVAYIAKLCPILPNFAQFCPIMPKNAQFCPKRLGLLCKEVARMPSTPRSPPLNPLQYRNFFPISFYVGVLGETRSGVGQPIKAIDHLFAFLTEGRPHKHLVERLGGRLQGVCKCVSRIPPLSSHRYYHFFQILRTSISAYTAYTAYTLYYFIT